VTSGPEPAADAIFALLRAIARDVAHELRGPVQAVVVNAEVARRKLASGETDAVAERIDIMESEVRRLHEMTDAFLSLIRPASAEPRVTGIDAALAQVDSMLATLARAAHVELRREREGDDALVRVRQQPLSLVLTAIVAALGAAAGPRGAVTLLRRTDPASVDLLITSEPGPADPGPGPASVAAPADPGPGPAPVPRAVEADAIRAAQEWIAADDGTVEAFPGSDPGRPGVRIRLPRADMA